MTDDFQVMKDFVKQRFRSKIGREFFNLDEQILKNKISAIVSSIIKENKLSLNKEDQELIAEALISDMLGLGPLEGLLKDPSVWEIMVNGPKQVYVERDGKLELTNVQFDTEEQLMNFIERILSPLGRRVTEFEPYVDARLNDGSRVNVIRRPIASGGVVLTIRKFSRRILIADDLIKLNTLDNNSARFLEACVKAKLNIIISGAPSAGKTTTLNVLVSYIPEDERIITIEDTLELQLGDRHKVGLETRPANIEGRGEITVRDLVKNALHMRPDRIIIGEVRSEEAFDMLQAMNTGQQGSMTTLHANSNLDALLRLESMAMIGNVNFSPEVIRKQIISAVDLIIQQARFPDGSRKITNISELVKTSRDQYELKDVYAIGTRYDESGRSVTGIKPTGHRPVFAERIGI